MLEKPAPNCFVLLLVTHDTCHRYKQNYMRQQPRCLQSTTASHYVIIQQ